MSQRSSPSHPVVVWSPGRVEAFDPLSGRTHVGASAVEIAGALGEGRVVVAAISRRNAFVRTARVPDATRHEIAQVLALTIANHVPVPAGDLAYDFRITDDVSADGRLIVIGAARIESLQAALADLAAAGLKATRVLPAAFGSELVAAHAGHKTCAVAEMTAEGLCIDLVTEGGVRYSRVAPTPADPALAANEVRRSFEIAGLPIGPVVAAGGLSLPGAQTVEETTLRALAMGADAIDIALESPETTAARRHSVEASRSRLAALLVGALLVMSGVVYFDYSEAATKAAASDAKYRAALRTVVSAKTAAETRATKAEALAKALDRAFDPAQPYGDVLGVLAAQAPDGVWLTGISIERGKPLIVRGTALQNEAVSTYLDSLRLAAENAPDGNAVHPRFRDVKLVVANNSNIEMIPVVQFSVSAHSIGNVPLVERTKGGR